MTTNAFLPVRFSELIGRLALGVEVVDPLAGGPVADIVTIAVDAPHAPGLVTSNPAAAMRAHGRGRWSLRYGQGPGHSTPTTLDLRISDDQRRHVPRRLHFTIPDEAQVLADAALDPPVITAGRRWQLELLPGANYPLPGRATALRGRVLRGGEPVRWARVEARTLVGAFAGRAHGDDRGEFLLVVDQSIGDTAELKAEIKLEVRAHGPEPVPTPAPMPTGLPDLPTLDPLWDLPVETPITTGPIDAVTRGITLPTSYTPGKTSPWTTVTCKLGSAVSCPTPFVLA